ncbi:piggyBac transposable element-derived protein 4-like [Vespula squamosa]|uniref:PiggyBac transposable element-derived protein 4-like n=1 Tax=Vespula squamosa TaxID=30214 RepID=A0ABD2BSR2_VESSQ
MAKRKLPQKVFCETENSNEEFCFDLMNTDSDRESDNVYSDSDSDIVPLKQRVRQLTISSDSEAEENDENENNTLLEKIVLETNKYAQNKIEQQFLSDRSTWNNWINVTKKELTAFLGVILNMGIIPIPNMKYYWTEDHILETYHFLEIYFGGKDFSEYFGCYIRMKMFPEIQIHSHPSGPSCQFKDCLTIVSQAVDRKSRGKRTSHLYGQIFYRDTISAGTSKTKSCYLTGTISTNRKYVPVVIKKPAVTKNNTVVSYRSGDILLLAWKDKRIVTILSSYDTSGTTTIKRRMKQGGTFNIIKPSVIINYNMNMGSVDKADQLANHIVSARRENMTVITHFMFVQFSVAQLISDFRDGTESKPGKPSTSDKEERLNGKLHILRHCENVKCKDCYVCSNRKIKGGRHQTNYFCDTCTRKPGLHVGECFEKYHTMENYKT